MASTLGILQLFHALVLPSRDPIPTCLHRRALTQSESPQTEPIGRRRTQSLAEENGRQPDKTDTRPHSNLLKSKTNKSHENMNLECCSVYDIKVLATLGISTPISVRDSLLKIVECTLIRSLAGPSKL